MKYFLSIIALLLIVFTSFGQTPSLFGQWRRLDVGKEISSNQERQQGDLILDNDSTFTFFGDKAAQKSEISGWNAGESFKGTWQIIGKSLYFYMDDLPIPLIYTIKRQNKSELHLQRPGDTYVMKYKRLY